MCRSSGPQAALQSAEIHRESVICAAEPTPCPDDHLAALLGVDERLQGGFGAAVGDSKSTACVALFGRCISSSEWELN